MVTLPATEILAKHGLHIASPVINECECVLHQACKRERSTESMTTTMHGLNLEEEHHVTLRHNEMPWVNGSYFTYIMLLLCRDQRPELTCTRTDTRAKHSTIQQWPQIMIPFNSFFFYLLCLRELKRTDWGGGEEKGGGGQCICG